MLKSLILLTLLLSVPSLEARQWRSSNAERSFEAEYVSNDGKLVTLKRGKKIVTFAISKLHRTDQAWLTKHHPPKEENPAGEDSPPAPKGAAFANLEFGDSRQEVTKKLRNSPAVDGDVAEELIPRIGLNGAYRTTQTIGGLHCYLYFDWTKSGHLREVTLRTKPLGGSSYSDRLKSNWEELGSLLTKLHGKPLQSGDYPSSDDLQDGLSLCSHLWHTEEGHSVLLGTGQDGSKYSVVVRITNQRIQPVVIE